MASITGPDIVSLRHTVATLAYRGNRALRNAPPKFAEFQAGATTRQPCQILAHVGDLLDWALSIVNVGRHPGTTLHPLPWTQEVDRFFSALEALDAPEVGLQERTSGCSARQSLSRSDRRCADPYRPDFHAPGVSSAVLPVERTVFIAEIVEGGRVGRDQAKPSR